MKNKTLGRLERLENQCKETRGVKVLCDDGTFINVNSPLEYVIKHGIYTATGKRLVSVVLPDEKMDGLSVSLIDYVNRVLSGDEILFTEMPNLTSDDVGGYGVRISKIQQKNRST